ncbi:MAG: AtpZ/AtpI family protein [Candidatus Celaenobacter antarcticus]|nr:AtpZ/AtpI family protein [Candidatus Celaenobacter antarcticus]MDP8314913.1 AtpZ/AtpI family protein [Candidatus Celaenobacter antarcticus]
MPLKNKGYYKEIFEGLGLVAQLGFTMVVNILIFFFIGLIIEKKWHLKGIPIMIGVFCGVISGAFSCYKLIKKNENSDK